MTRKPAKKKEPNSNHVRLMLRIPKEDHEKLVLLCEMEGEVPMTRIGWIRTQIRRAWNARHNHKA